MAEGKLTLVITLSHAISVTALLESIVLDYFLISDMGAAH